MNAPGPTIIPPPKYAASPSTWKSKLALRGFAALCCIIVGAVGGSIAALKDIEGDFMLMLGPPVGVAFVWNIVEGFCIWKRPGNRGIHPGAIVAIDLVLWMVLALVDFSLAAVGLVFSSQRLIRGTYYHNGSYLSDDDVDEEELERLLKLADKIQGRGRVVVGFLGFLVIAHFVLFVVGCMETHRRNRMPKTVYVVQQPIYPQGANGQPQYPLVQYPQQQFYAPPPPGFQPVPVPMPMQMQMQSASAQAAPSKPEAQPLAGPERYA
ncbi:hypothetical protein QBC43DRAFT_240320 [Cladorrhinum sp. PSN259]|nr:hypothetical protein QBC43DRAFT_240320 [Cladorrhinum sp. PSN259]